MLATALGSTLQLLSILLLVQVEEPQRTVPAEVAASSPPTKSFHEAVQFTERLKELGPWQTHYRTVTHMVDQMFTRNGWNSEPDLFVRSLVTRVSAMPPWDVRGRIDTVVGQLSTRYQLSPDQRAELGKRVWRDTITMTTRSFPAVLPTLKDMLETRTSGEPFTAEQVSQWMRTIRPIMKRNLTYVQGSISEFRESLTPAQCAILDRDLVAADRRITTWFTHMRVWERGQWTPEDWGLQGDAIHRRAANRPQLAGRKPRAQRQRTAPPAEIVSPSGRRMTRDQDPWAQHVQRFITRYKLDEGQQTSAWSIYEELRSRADQWLASHADELAKIEALARDGVDAESRRAAEKRLDEQTEVVQQMFEELKSRLDDLLTSDQRARGGEGT